MSEEKTPDVIGAGRKRLRMMRFNTHLRGQPIRVDAYAAQIVQPYVIEFDLFAHGTDEVLRWVLEPNELAAICAEIGRHRFGA